MEKIRMADVIPLLPLPTPPLGKSAYYVPCPHCDMSGLRKDMHLNINIQKEVFRCARCGWNGGIFDLYSHYSGTPRKKAREELYRVLNKTAPTMWPAPFGEKTAREYKHSAPPESPEPPIAGISARHSVYSALLSLLSLARDHMDNLLGRGLSEDVISRNGYKTTPVAGTGFLAKQLLKMGHTLIGVPGFYEDGNGQWSFISMRRGILIPVRDVQGQIQGLQVRLDNQSRRKYRWVSSGGIGNGTNGCGAEGWVHLAGPVRECITLIEGPLKADVVHHLVGQTVVAVPGVNSLKHLESALTDMRELGMKRIMTAFDMDFLKNPHVKNGYGELVSLLGRMGIPFGTYLWSPDYNGLDDYVWGHCLRRGL